QKCRLPVSADIDWRRLKLPGLKRIWFEGWIWIEDELPVGIDPPGNSRWNACTICIGSENGRRKIGDFHGTLGNDLITIACRRSNDDLRIARRSIGWNQIIDLIRRDEK